MDDSVRLADETTLVVMDMHATQGPWGQFSSTSGPWQEEATKLWKTNRKRALQNHDTSHHVSSMQDDGPRRVAEFRHAGDAEFAEALVNLWRAGYLTYTGDLG